MGETIYEGHIVDTRFTPPLPISIYYGKTEKETIDFLKKTGGIYKNTLHNFQFKVLKEN